MKRFLFLALTGLLLAGCAAAPADERAASGAAVQEASAPPIADTASAPMQPLRPLQKGDANQYYMTDLLAGGLVRCWAADLVERQTAVLCQVEGCAHQGPDCPAVHPRGEMDQPFVLDEDTLVYFGNNCYPETSDSPVVFLDRSCQNPRTVATVEGATLDARGSEDGRTPYTDGQYLYCFGWQGGYGGRAALFRIDPGTGEVTDLLADLDTPMDQVLGAVGTRMLFVQWERTDEPEDPYSIAPITATIHWALDLTDGTLTQLARYERVGDTPETARDRVIGRVLDGQYYQFDLDAHALRVWEPETNTFRLITDALPDGVLETADKMVKIVQDWIVFHDPLWMVNLQTGEVQGKAPLPDNYWNGDGHQPYIYLDLGDTLLVDCRYEPRTRVDLGPDGTPATVETHRRFLGLISAQDFLNGVPRYTEIGESIG